MLNFLSNLFCNKYYISAVVELENGEIYRVKVTIESCFATKDEIIYDFKNECRKRLGSSVKKIIEFYDVS